MKYFKSCIDILKVKKNIVVKESIYAVRNSLRNINLHSNIASW